MSLCLLTAFYIVINYAFTTHTVRLTCPCSCLACVDGMLAWSAQTCRVRAWVGLAMAQLLVCVGWDWKRGPAAHDIDWQADEHSVWGYWSAVKCTAQIYDGTETGMDRTHRSIQAAFPVLVDLRPCCCIGTKSASTAGLHRCSITRQEFEQAYTTLIATRAEQPSGKKAARPPALRRRDDLGNIQLTIHSAQSAEHIACVSIKWCCRAHGMATLAKGCGAFRAAYAALFLHCPHFVALCGALAILCLRRPIARLSSASSALFKLHAFCRAL